VKDIQPRDFNDFSELLLIAAADRQTNSSEQSSDLYLICRSNAWDVPTTWIDQAARSYKDRRLSAVMVGSGEAFFNLQSMGFAEATRLKRERYPTASDKLASDKVQKISSLLVSFLSLLISFAALIVAAFALVKAK
jgi:hypothetical protein